jgi:hypothetical protein
MQFQMPMKVKSKPNRSLDDRPPSHLTPKSKEIWKAVINEFELSSESLQLLRVGLENLDLGDKARELLRKC